MRKFLALLLVATFVGGCATIPGSNVPKESSSALAQPETTRLGAKLDALAQEHPGVSGYRLLVQGADALKARIELTDAAERTLDLQYFIVHNDTSGKLLMSAVLRAAQRGVRVRMLVDDTGDIAGEQQVAALAADPQIEIRVFNPYFTRGLLELARYAEFIVAGQRLNYRMHNKLFVADNAAAVLGGRNVGDEYFQASTEKEFGDFDVFAVGPIVKQLSESFDEYWNSDLAIPVQALPVGKPDKKALEQYRDELAKNDASVDVSSYKQKLEKIDLLQEVAVGGDSMHWAKSALLYDSPKKKKVEAGEEAGSLMRRQLGEAVRATHSELLIVSPYLVPGDGGLKALKDMRARGVKIRILTNSLASTDMPIVHSGYRHYRHEMLDSGIELYEVRPHLGNTDGGGSGGSLKSPSSGAFGLHAKVFILDRQRVFVGSMNFDRRSLRINTEMGLLIDSPALADQIVKRFDAIAQPANCYVPRLAEADPFGRRPLTWTTEENGKLVESSVEPMGDPLRGIMTGFMTLLPLDDFL